MRRFLNPAFLDAVRQSKIPRQLQAQLVGYGASACNLTTDLNRKDGAAYTLKVRERMAKLAQLVGFPEEQVWV